MGRAFNRNEDREPNISSMVRTNALVAESCVLYQQAYYGVQNRQLPMVQ